MKEIKLKNEDFNPTPINTTDEIIQQLEERKIQLEKMIESEIVGAKRLKKKYDKTLKIKYMKEIYRTDLRIKRMERKIISIDKILKAQREK